ncbi:MAG: hypothetical protein ACE5KA_05945 [Nitrososphaerales archaeon]
MLPDRCSLKDSKGDCPNPPSYVVSITHNSGEYMVGVVCEEHRVTMEKRIIGMQNAGDLLQGKIKFVPVKPVATDCVTNYPEKWEGELDQEQAREEDH